MDDEGGFDPTQNTQVEDIIDEVLDGGGEAPWGRLVSLNARYPNVDLVEDVYLLGRGRKASHGLRYDDIRVSGLHCKVERQVGRGGGAAATVFVTDLSSNGTYVNGHIVGKNNRLALTNNDEVALVIITKGPDMAGANACVAYLFQDLAQGDGALSLTGTLDPELDETIGSRYALRHTLGSGAFAQVKLGCDLRTGERVAVKIIDINKFRLNKQLRPESLMDEVRVLQAIQHQGIVSIIDSFKTERFLYLVLELVTGGELFDRIVDRGPFAEPDAARLLVQLTDAVAYLHSVGVVHRDIKLENILFESPDPDAPIKLTDFGLARIIGASQLMTTLCGTPQYLAPEVILSQQSNAGYDASIDLWSVGVILYIMLCGHPPFYEERQIPMYTQITEGMVAFDTLPWASVSASAISLVSALLTVDPAHRLGLPGIYAHPWVQTHCPGAALSVDLSTGFATAAAAPSPPAPASPPPPPPGSKRPRSGASSGDPPSPSKRPKPL